MLLQGLVCRLIVAVVIVSIGVNPEFISEESTKRKHSVPIYIDFKDHNVLVSVKVQNKREFQHTKSQALLM
jgi:hypothetical protein